MLLKESWKSYSPHLPFEYKTIWVVGVGGWCVAELIRNEAKIVCQLLYKFLCGFHMPKSSEWVAVWMGGEFGNKANSSQHG